LQRKLEVSIAGSAMFRLVILPSDIYFTPSRGEGEGQGAGA